MTPEGSVSEPREPALVVLAAGASRRLGTCKATVELGGRPALLRLLEAGSVVPGPAIVVAGAEHDAIRSILGPDDHVELVRHDDWESGRTGSLAAAVRRLADRDVIVAPVDCPLVSRRVFETLIDGDIILQTDGRPYRGGLLYKLEFESPGRFADDLRAEVKTLAEVDPTRTSSPHSACN